MTDEPPQQSPEEPAPATGRAPSTVPPRRSGLGRISVLLALAVVAVVLAAVEQAGAARGVVAGPAATSGRGSEIVIDGRGWGHGRGMSQYGAYGYAATHGWSSGQILDHFYGNTTAGPAPSPGEVDPARTRVDLVFMRSRETAVSIQDGQLHLMASDGSTLQRVTGAVRLTVSGGSMTVATAPNCAGPWTAAPSIDRTLVRIEAETTADGQAGLLQVCGPSYSTWYDGEIWATSAEGRQRTLNVVSIEQYLRGVVPNEVPASWPSAALEAQAVAARSYALAGDHRWTGYADTCDTTLCQVYDGRFTTRAGWRQATHARTDAAIDATAGLVRLHGDGSVARTEFSSSSGGHTTGGDFPGVADLGDSIAANPNHTWTRTVDLAGLEQDYGLGRVEGLVVAERDGYGTWGGRAVTVQYHFEQGTVTVTGDQARRYFGLKSTFFAFSTLTRDGVEIESIDPAAIARFVDEAYLRLTGRAPTGAEAERWRAEVRNGTRLRLTEELVHSGHFSGVLVDELYQTALGRPSDADGRSYWVATMADGLKYEHLGTLFYGSTEYVNRSGGTNETFVRSLYRNILGRDPDPEGLAYWLGLLETGRATPADVANAFYRSIESRRDRARAAHVRVLGTEPGSSQIERNAERLLLVDDLALSAELATALGREPDG